MNEKIFKEQPEFEEILNKLFLEKFPGDSLYIIRTNKQGALQTIDFGEHMPTCILLGTLELVKSLVIKSAFAGKENVSD